MGQEDQKDAGQEARFVGHDYLHSGRLRALDIDSRQGSGAVFEVITRHLGQNTRMTELHYAHLAPNLWPTRSEQAFLG
jgi:hypothetical protein